MGIICYIIYIYIYKNVIVSISQFKINIIALDMYPTLTDY